MLNDASDSKYFIRDKGLNAFDGVAFHYTVYRFLSRFLGLDGTFTAEGDPPNVSWIDFWQTIILTNDMINANDGTRFDPRHMYGATNQDVFRWPTIKNGTQKQLLGYFIVALLLPGIPTLVWGEEQVCRIQFRLSYNPKESLRPGMLRASFFPLCNAPPEPRHVS